ERERRCHHVRRQPVTLRYLIRGVGGDALLCLVEFVKPVFHCFLRLSFHLEITSAAKIIPARGKRKRESLWGNRVRLDDYPMRRLTGLPLDCGAWGQPLQSSFNLTLRGAIACQIFS